MPLDAKTPKIDKSKLPSRHVSVGPASAPHRSYYYAMGMTDEEIAQPFVGVATCWNEAAPCNIALSRQAQSVKQGVKAAAGTPREFTSITVTDGIAPPKPILVWLLGMSSLRVPPKTPNAAFDGPGSPKAPS